MMHCPDCEGELMHYCPICRVYPMLPKAFDDTRTPSSATPEVSELVERLRLGTLVKNDGRGVSEHRSTALEREAATALETLEVRVRLLEEALVEARVYVEAYGQQNAETGTQLQTIIVALLAKIDTALDTDTPDIREG